MALTRTLRRARRWLWGIVNVLVLSYCAFLAGVILYHYPVRFDLSADQTNTLSDDTLVSLENLKRPVEVLVLWGEADPRKRWAVGKVIRRTEDVLRQMALATDKIKIIDFVDIFQRNETYLRLKERYGITGYNRVVLLCGKRRQAVRLEDLAELTYSPRGVARIVCYRVERALVAGLRRLQGEPRTLYVLRNEGTGGRVGPTIHDTTPRGFSHLAEELRSNNWRVRELNLMRTGKVPDDCDVLMAVGLVGPLPGEIPPIVSYLKRGGKFFLALNPLVEVSFLRFLAEWGFLVEPAWTVMEIPVAGTAIQVENVIVTGFNPSHPITRKFQKDTFNVSFVFARPIDAAKGTYGQREGILFAQGKNMWGERRIDDRPWSKDSGDFASPVCVGGVVEVRRFSAVARLAVFGAANWLTNRDLRARDHLSVLHNTLWWLVGQEELVSVRKVAPGERNLNFDPEGKVRRLLGWVFLGLVPGASVVLGLGVFLLRRK